MLAMLRPRPAGFDYDDSDLQVMYQERAATTRRRCRRHRVRCVGPSPKSQSGRVSEAAGNCRAPETVFHRAIDLVPDIQATTAKLAELGVTRVLTSGQQRTAADGAECIAKLQRELGDRIEILPASGVSPDNAALLIQRTGCRQLHGSFSCAVRDHAGDVAPPEYRSTSESLVRATRQAVDASQQALRVPSE